MGDVIFNKYQALLGGTIRCMDVYSERLPGCLWSILQITCNGGVRCVLDQYDYCNWLARLRGQNGLDVTAEQTMT